MQTTKTWTYAVVFLAGLMAGCTADADSDAADAALPVTVDPLMDSFFTTAEHDGDGFVSVYIALRGEFTTPLPSPPISEARRLEMLATRQAEAHRLEAPLMDALTAAGARHIGGFFTSIAIHAEIRRAHLSLVTVFDGVDSIEGPGGTTGDL